MFNRIPIKFSKLSEGIVTPSYAYTSDAGFDIASNENLVMPPNSLFKIGTGLKVHIPEGYEIQIRSRSGLASKGIVVNNSPGTIDSGYRNEIKILLLNQTGSEFKIRKGDRIAQGILAISLQAMFNEVEDINIDRGESGIERQGERGEKGFGSSG